MCYLTRSAKIFIFLRFFFVACLFLSYVEVHAQEICDNGIDDDGDGLIDINDPDCQCHFQASKNLLLNPSFEEYKHCFIWNVDISQNFDMVNNWLFGPKVSAGNDIFYNNKNCPEYSNIVYAYPKLTPHSGDGLITLIENGKKDIPIPENETQKDYITQCLQAPLLKNKEYTFTFYTAAFTTLSTVDSANITSLPFSVAVFGNPDCNAVPFGLQYKHSGCPANYAGWTMLGEISRIIVHNEWVQFKINFTVPENINVIAIGPDCTLPDNVTFFSLDDVQLAETKDFDFQSVKVQSGAPCTGGYVLSVPSFTGANYQWYRNGIAIAGQKDSIFNVPDSLGQAIYNVRISKDGNCKISEPLTLPVSKLLQLTFPADTNICKNDTLILGKALAGVSYSWNGQQGKIVTISDPGIYHIAATDTLDCQKNFSVNVHYKECAPCNVFMPTAFTPNGDGLNDVLKGYSSCQLDEYWVQIFDRWGEKVFESHSLENGWDATFKGKRVPQDIYTYFIRYKYSSFQKDYHVKRGTVTVIR
jgi:gliding motility-associated-like protein